MDPLIVKLLEADEDENAHSGKDVEALTAALNRDIEGGTPFSQIMDSNQGILSNGSSSLLTDGQAQTCCQEDSSCQEQEPKEHSQPHEQRLSGMQILLQGSSMGIPPKQDSNSPQTDQLQLQHKQSWDDQQGQKAEENSVRLSKEKNTQLSEKKPTEHAEEDIQKLPSSGNISQQSTVQQSHNEKSPETNQPNKPVVEIRSNYNVPFGSLIPILLQQIEKDRQMQLMQSFTRLRKNEISKSEFLKAVRNIVGEQMLKSAALTLQDQQVRAQVQAPQNLQVGPGQFKLQSQASSQLLTAPSSSGQQLAEAKLFSQVDASIVHQKESVASAHSSHTSVSAAEMQKDAGNSAQENNAQKPREVEHPSDVQVSQTPNSVRMIEAKRDTEPSVSSVHTVTKQQWSSHSLVPWYMDDSSKYPANPSSRPSTSLTAASINSPTEFPQSRQVQHSQRTAPMQSGAADSKNEINMRHHDLRNATNDANKNSSSGAAPFGLGSTALGPSNNDGAEKHATRIGIPTTNMLATHQISGTTSKQAEHMMQMRSQNASTTTAVGTGTSMRTPSKRPFASQKSVESFGTPATQPSKKQKVSGVSLDESIEHLNDVTAVSGVNLREEEEQLLSGHKEESVASEGIRRTVQVEEERMILQKVPLQKKLSEITSKCGIKNMKDDVERCLSMCVEERMRGLIHNLRRLSKQRADVEKPRHMIYVTSDVRRQILMMNRKAKEEWDKKQAEEAEKLRKNNENEGNTGGDMDKEKDEGRLKAVKANKEEDDKMRATAANVAARVAAGGDDMLSKWQLMAEQARKKREGMQDGASGAQLGKNSISRPMPVQGKTMRDNQEAEHRTHPSSSATAFGSMRKFGWNQPGIPQAKSAPTISVKDVIAVLEREPQMARSTLIYRLYDRMPADGTVE